VSVTSAVLDVESVRFSGERWASQAIRERWEVPVVGAEEHRRAIGSDGEARLATSVLLSADLSPATYATSEEVRNALGVDKAVEVYQSLHAGKFQDDGFATATVDIHTADPTRIRIIGASLKQLDRGALMGVLGHEIGHHVAHVSPLPDDVLGLREKYFLGVRERSSPLLSYLALSQEITADRFGLLACPHGQR